MSDKSTVNTLDTAPSLYKEVLRSDWDKAQATIEQQAREIERLNECWRDCRANKEAFANNAISLQQRIAALRAQQPGVEAVAWGVPDTTPGEHRPFLLLVHHPSQVADPKDLVPLYTHRQPAPAGVVVDRELLESIVAHLEWDGGPVTAYQYGQNADRFAAELRALLNQSGGE